MQEATTSNSYVSSKKQRHKYKHNYRLSFLLILFIAVIIFVILSVTVFFNIETIIVKGSSIYTAEEIIDSSSLKAGDNMIRTNMSNAVDRINKKLVYTEEVNIKRIFPDKVEITVTPCTETAVLYNEESCFLTSKSGKILDTVDSNNEKLLRITGVEPAESLETGDIFKSADESKTKIINKLLQYDYSEESYKINNFDITDKLNISCIYDNRIKIELGVMSELDYKLKFANQIILKKLGNTSEGTLKILSNGEASFLDKKALEDNDIVYNNNIKAKEESETALSETATNATDTDNSEENTGETQNTSVTME